MSVVPLTLAISLMLVVLFIVFFVREHSRGESSSPERDSLLPFEDEKPHVAVRAPARDQGTKGQRTKPQTPTSKLQ